MPWLRRRPVWTVSVLLAVPLGALFCLQLSWLVHARDSFAGALRADRQDFLEKLATEIEYTYRNAAERALNLPSYLFEEDRVGEAAPYFTRSGMEMARHVFASRLLAEDWVVEFYDAPNRRMSRMRYSPLVRDVIAACTDLKIRAERGEVLYSAELIVVETNRSQPIVLNPIVDRRSRIVGVAGMVLDAEYLERAVVPGLVERSRDGAAGAGVDVTLRNVDGAVVYTTAIEPPMRAGERNELSLPFAFGGWSLGLSNRSLSPEELARRNFAVNTLLLGAVWLLVVVVLVAGLRAVSRELKLSQLKADFVSNVSHELRTPLASIRVFGELLGQGRVRSPEKVQEYGSYVESESRRLTQLVNNILDFSRIESRGKSYHFEPVDLADVLRETIDAFSVRLERDEFDLIVEAPDSELPKVSGDRQSLVQAIGNLLDNAIKYSGEVRSIRVTLRRKDGAVEIAVTDQGIGIPRADQERIFERFHRVGTGDVHDVKGSGLGLAIVGHIVEAHGGQVGVRSERGRGSTFTLRLPVERRHDGSADLRAAEPLDGAAT